MEEQSPLNLESSQLTGSKMNFEMEENQFLEDFEETEEEDEIVELTEENEEAIAIEYPENLW
jgi:hypothetical protein